MRIGVFFNKIQVGEAAAYGICEALRREGADAEAFFDEEAIVGFDRLIVLGGDGTVLRAARRAAEENIPLFGINYGHTGFLTEFERDETEEAVSFALSNCDCIERSMLEVDLNGNKTFCLNDCSLMRSVTPRGEYSVVKIGVRIDGTDAGEIVADGVVVATPTGSTAYSLSAGGCIMTPACKTFMFTPICPLSMKSRPIVYSETATLSLAVPEGKSLLLYGDGRYLGEVRASDAVLIKRAARSVTFLTRNKKNYFLRITEKIS